MGCEPNLGVPSLSLHRGALTVGGVVSKLGVLGAVKYHWPDITAETIDVVEKNACRIVSVYR